MQIYERQIVINRRKLSLSAKCLLSRFLDEYWNLMSAPNADECAMDISGDKAAIPFLRVDLYRLSKEDVQNTQDID